MFWLRRFWALATLGRCVLSKSVDDRFETTDLETFVTRPDIRPPKFDVIIHNEEAIEPGYWFTAPYVDLNTRDPTSAFSPAQVGPHIYDNKGNLVYSGSHILGERTSFDFRSVNINGSEHLTLLVDRDDTRGEFAAGAGIIFDSHFKMKSSVQNLIGTRAMNMHEFNIVDGGQRALTITYEPQLFDYSNGNGVGPYGWIGNNGFQEVDLSTGKVTFSWWALDHIDSDESTMQESNGHGSGKGVWDWFHLNSVDKNSDGDYLISARYTNSIYKISGKDGHIIWRLGGKKSSFKQLGFRFSAQHDARFRRQNQTHTVISFLNNAANGHFRTSNTSAVLIVDLDTSSMQASLIQEFQRPDGALTKLRGNAQEMPNGNYFICWSENSHFSEHTADGRLLMEAHFRSNRFVTYRGGKFNFTGRPEWAPAAKAFNYGVNPRMSTTTIYASWNGATEVEKWRFWGSNQATSLKNFELLGEVTKETFESLFMMTGFVPFIYAEAVSQDDRSLGLSPVIEVQTPEQSTPNAIATGAQLHHPVNPSPFDHDQSLECDQSDGQSSQPGFIWTWPTDSKRGKQVAAIAIYLWIISALYGLAYLCRRYYRRNWRKVPWMKSQI